MCSLVGDLPCRELELLTKENVFSYVFPYIGECALLCVPLFRRMCSLISENVLSYAFPYSGECVLLYRRMCSLMCFVKIGECVVYVLS